MVLKITRYHLLTLFKVILVVPLCILIFIAASGYFFGGTRSLPTTIVSWFVIVPLLNAFLSKIISGQENSAFKSLISLLTVYGVMIFMIYKHYQTDFFKVMIASLIFNALVLIAIGIAGFAGAWSRNTAN